MKKKQKKHYIKHSELPTPERMRKEGGIKITNADYDSKGEVVAVKAVAGITHSLDWYLSKNSIDQRMHDAGMLFHRYFHMAGKTPKVTTSLKPPSDGNEGGYERFMILNTDAQKKINDALDELNADERDVIREVCGLSNRAGSSKRTLFLKTGLTALAVHWGLRADNYR